MKTSVKRNLFYLIVFFGLTNGAYAQTICGPNVVPNHDFETSDPVLCPSTINGVGQLWIDTSQVTNWYGTSFKNGSGNGITPDHYNNLCTGNSGMACMQGNASVGVFTSTNSGSGTQNTREYLQAELTAPLIAGSTYFIQMTVSSGSGSNWAHTDGYGAWFRQDTGPFDIGTQGGQPWIANNAQFLNPAGNIIDNNCQTISGYFCADGGENWIMLGNFREDFQMTVSTTSGGGAGSSAYVIVDEIFVQEVCPGTNPSLFDIVADQNPLSCGQAVTVEGMLMTSSYGTITYQWISPGSISGSTNLGPITETLTQNTTYALEYVVAGACGNYTDTAYIDIDVNSGVNISLNSLVDETCIGDCDGSVDVSLSGGTPPYANQWYNSGGGALGTSTNISALCSDIYTIEVTTTESVQQTDVIFTEDFESGVNGWTLNTNPTGGTNDANNNLWEINNDAIGSNTGSCTPSSDGVLNLMCPAGCGNDEYDNINTSIMAESPVINTTGYTNLNLTFDYLAEANGANAQGSFYYNDGGGWTFLTDLLSATCWGPYNGWDSYAVTLPISMNNIANAQIGFQWMNTDYIITEDWGLSINNINITAETPINVVCTEIDSFTISGVSCTGCAPPTLTTNNLNVCAPGTVDLNSGVTTSHVNGAPNVSFYATQADADAATNAIGATISVSGTYYVRSEDPLDAACYITATIDVTVDPAPNAGTAGATTLCTSDASVDLFTLLGGSPDAGGTWSPAMTSGTGVFDPGTDAGATYTYSVTNGCGTASADVVVTLNPAPNAGTVGSTSLCSTDPSVDLFTLLGGTPDGGGSWSPAMTSGTGVFDPGVDADGTYTYTVTNGCGTVSTDVTVTVTSNPDPGTNGTLSICSGAASVDLFNSLNGTPTAGGTWSPALTSGTGVFDPASDPAGTYTYTLNACGGGTLTADVTVTIDPAPNAGTVGSTSLCATDPSVDLFTLLGGTPDAGGSWTPAMTSGTGVFDPGVDADGIFNYTVTNGCGTVSTDVTVTVTASPDPGINGTLSICSGAASVDLLNSLNGTPTAGGTWSPALTSGTGIFDPLSDPAGTYTYTLNACGGGTLTADVVVTVTTGPNTGTAGAATYCTSDAAVDLFTLLGGTPDAGGTWAPAMTSGTGVFDPGTDAGGIYTYTVTNGCGTASTDVTITISNNPDPGTNGATSLCANDASVDLFGLLGGTPDVGGTWSPALTSGTGMFDPSSDAGGTYTYSINACGGGTLTADVVVTVNPLPIAGTSGTISFCSNDAASDLTSALGGTPDAGGTWSPALTSGTGIFDPTSDAAGTYTYTVTNSCGSTSADVVVTIDNCDSPQAGFTVDNLAICLGDCINLTDTSLFNPESWVWDFGGAATPNTSTQQHPSICPDSVGVFTITLTATNVFGSDVATLSITVNETPTVDAGLDTTIEMNTEAILYATGSPAGGTYLWLNDDVDCSICQLTYDSPSFTSDYVVIYTTDNGCIASDSVTVTVLFEDVIDVPNGFSPNGDGNNDVLSVEGAGIQSMTFLVYNRYGQKIFESNSQAVGWDGTVNGTAENPGVFAWYLSYSLIDGSSGMKKGNVTLIK